MFALNTLVLGACQDRAGFASVGWLLQRRLRRFPEANTNKALRTLAVFQPG